LRAAESLGRRDLLFVFGCFAAARIMYALLGVSFDASTFPHYLQFIDADLLKTRLLESLWYLHSGPPMLNLVVGLGYKIFGIHANSFFSVLFHALGVSIALCVYMLTLRLSSSRSAAGIVTAVLVFSPAFVLYENWLMYTFPTVALLTASALLLHQYVQSRRTSWCVAFFSTLAALLLTRSVFHVAWLVLTIGLLAALFWERRRQVLLAATLPLLVVLFWYGKNYYLFGTFSSSTLLGLGLTNITTLVVPRTDLGPLVEQGKLSPFALVSRYEQRDALFTSQPYLPLSGIPVLDQVKKADGSYNYNNQQMIRIDRIYTHDALEVIRTFPASYVLGLYISNRLFFSPPSMNAYFSVANRNAALPVERIYNPVIYGARPRPLSMQQPHFGLPSRYVLEVNTSLAMFVSWWVLLGYAYVQARRGVLSRKANLDARSVVMGFFVLTASYLYVVGTGFELAENYRYRYDIEPLFFAIAAVAVTDLMRVLRARRAAPRAIVTRSPAS
jgi:hypothetical protein